MRNAKIAASANTVLIWNVLGVLATDMMVMVSSTGLEVFPTAKSGYGLKRDMKLEGSVDMRQEPFSSETSGTDDWYELKYKAYESMFDADLTFGEKVGKYINRERFIDGFEGLYDVTLGAASGKGLQDLGKGAYIKPIAAFAKPFIFEGTREFFVHSPKLKTFRGNVKPIFKDWVKLNPNEKLNHQSEYIGRLIKAADMHKGDQRFGQLVSSLSMVIIADSISANSEMLSNQNEDIRNVLVYGFESLEKQLAQSSSEILKQQVTVFNQLRVDIKSGNIDVMKFVEQQAIEINTNIVDVKNEIIKANKAGDQETVDRLTLVLKALEKGLTNQIDDLSDDVNAFIKKWGDKQATEQLVNNVRGYGAIARNSFRLMGTLAQAFGADKETVKVLSSTIPSGISAMVSFGLMVAVPNPLSVGAFIGSLVDFIGSFLDSGPSPYEIISKQLEDIGNMLVELDMKLVHIDKKLDLYFVQLEVYLRHIGEALLRIEKTQERTLQQLETLRHETYHWLRALYEEGFDSAKYWALNHQKMFVLSNDDYKLYSKKIIEWVNVHAKKNVVTGDHVVNFDPHEIVTQLSRGELLALGFLANYAKHFTKFTSKDKPANLMMWEDGLNTYVNFLNQVPDETLRDSTLHKDPKTNVGWALTGMRNVGEETQNFIKDLGKHQPLFVHLFSQYNKVYEDVIKVIEKISYAFMNRYFEKTNFEDINWAIKELKIAQESLEYAFIGKSDKHKITKAFDYHYETLEKAKEKYKTDPFNIYPYKGFYEQCKNYEVHFPLAYSETYSPNDEKTLTVVYPIYRFMNYVNKYKKLTPEYMCAEMLGVGRLTYEFDIRFDLAMSDGLTDKVYYDFSIFLRPKRVIYRDGAEIFKNYRSDYKAPLFVSETGDPLPEIKVKNHFLGKVSYSEDTGFKAARYREYWLHYSKSMRSHDSGLKYWFGASRPDYSVAVGDGRFRPGASLLSDEIKMYPLKDNNSRLPSHVTFIRSNFLSPSGKHSLSSSVVSEVRAVIEKKSQALRREIRDELIVAALEDSDFYRKLERLDAYAKLIHAYVGLAFGKAIMNNATFVPSTVWTKSDIVQALSTYNGTATPVHEQMRNNLEGLDAYSALISESAASAAESKEKSEKLLGYPPIEHFQGQATLAQKRLELLDLSEEKEFSHQQEKTEQHSAQPVETAVCEEGVCATEHIDDHPDEGQHFSTGRKLMQLDEPLNVMHMKQDQPQTSSAVRLEPPLKSLMSSVASVFKRRTEKEKPSSRQHAQSTQANVNRGEQTRQFFNGLNSQLMLGRVYMHWVKGAWSWLKRTCGGKRKAVPAKQKLAVKPVSKKVFQASIRKLVAKLRKAEDRYKALQNMSHYDQSDLRWMYTVIVDHCESINNTRRDYKQGRVGADELKELNDDMDELLRYVGDEYQQATLGYYAEEQVKTSFNPSFFKSEQVKGELCQLPALEFAGNLPLQVVPR